MPQEHGNRTAVRWLRLKNNTKNGLQFTGEVPLSTSVWPYSAETLDKAKHTNELTNDEDLTVNIDLIQAGVGGTDSWSIKARTIDKYRLLKKTYKYSFTIKAL